MTAYDDITASATVAGLRVLDCDQARAEARRGWRASAGCRTILNFVELPVEHQLRYCGLCPVRTVCGLEAIGEQLQETVRGGIHVTRQPVMALLDDDGELITYGYKHRGRIGLA